MQSARALPSHPKENLLLDEKGNVKLTDMGLAKADVYILHDFTYCDAMTLCKAFKRFLDAMAMLSPLIGTTQTQT